MYIYAFIFIYTYVCVYKMLYKCAMFYKHTATISLNCCFKEYTLGDHGLRSVILNFDLGIKDRFWYIFLRPFDNKNFPVLTNTGRLFNPENHTALLCFLIDLFLVSLPFSDLLKPGMSPLKTLFCFVYQVLEKLNRNFGHISQEKPQ